MKQLFSILIFVLFAITAEGQVANIVGVCQGNGDPNLIAILDDVNQLVECTTYKDTTGGIFWVYNDANTAGVDRWVAVSVGTGTDLSVINNTSTTLDVASSTGTNVTIPQATGTFAGVMSAFDKSKSTFLTVTQLVNLDDLEADVADLTTLSGVASNATDLGTFAENIISDNTTIKGALQDLETASDGHLDNTLTDTYIHVGNGSNVATGVNMTGDVSISNTGVTTVVDGTTTVKGKVELATDAEAIAGTATDVVLTPSNLQAASDTALPVYVSNAAAITGGLVAGEKWRCGTGSTQCSLGSVHEVY